MANTTVKIFQALPDGDVVLAGVRSGPRAARAEVAERLERHPEARYTIVAIDDPAPLPGSF